MSECIAYKCSVRARWRCIGSGTKWVRRTGVRWQRRASGCRSSLRSTPIRPRSIRRQRLCHRPSTNSCFLRKRPVSRAKAITCDLEVPAEAEVVIEGYIDPSEPLVVEGPFGDHTGFYSEADLYPQVHVTALTMRHNPVYATTIVGRPPMEDYYLGHATERIFLPLLKLTIPEIVDYHMPAEGIFHNLVFVSIDKQYPGQAYKVMNAMWGQGLMSLAKVIVVLDKDVNVRNVQEAWWVALNHIDPERDVRFSMGPIDVLDHSSRAFTYGSKMGIDATRKWPEEGFTRNWPKLIEMDPATKTRVDSVWAKLGLGPNERSERWQANDVR